MDIKLGPHFIRLHNKKTQEGPDVVLLFIHTDILILPCMPVYVQVGCYQMYNFVIWAKQKGGYTYVIYLFIVF